MAYRPTTKFGSDFEAWLDDKLARIRSEANPGRPQRVNATTEVSKLSSSGDKDIYGVALKPQTPYSSSGSNNNNIGVSDKFDSQWSSDEDSAREQTEYGDFVTSECPGLGDGYAEKDVVDWVVADPGWEEEESYTFTMSSSRSPGGGGGFYTTVFMDDGGLDEPPAAELPQTPSARDTVARILRETELGPAAGDGGGAPGRQATRYDFVPSGGEDFAQTGGPLGFDDDWDLEDEPAVSYRQLREAGDGGSEGDPSPTGDRIYRRSADSGSAGDEFADAVEELPPPGGDELDIRTPTGKGRALLPMMDAALELSFDEDEEEEDVLDMDDVATITMHTRGASASDRAPIIMDARDLQQRALARRRRVRIIVIAVTVVVAVTAAALVTYLTVHMLST